MTLPHISEAIRAEDSSLKDRKIRVRSVWRSVRQASPARQHGAERGDRLRGDDRDAAALPRQRERLLVASEGSSWPTVANAWYSSQMNTAGRR